ncbi:MAG: cbb3-type cytochrome c oxidase subunit I [Acidimicrobiia bacterium]|nr:cbb3-type cytochrome c oxidase subunit I [Acidimicrobiia bacterium]NNL13189.1 c-type cytochrome [Acidimicrobiia bacterium]
MTTEATAQTIDIGAGADSLARLHFRVASVFLALGALAGLILAIELSAPSFLNSGPLSYGRLFPVFTGALLFGWVTVGLIGAIYYLLPRLTGADLQDEALARLSLILVAGGSLVGIIAIAAGRNQGVPLFEFPFYADIAVIVGLAGVTRVVSRTALAHREPHVYISVWFFVAAVWWLLFSYVIGSLSGFRGTDLELANRFAEAGVLFLWVIPAGLGIAYYLIPKLTDSPLYSMRLAVVSFWTMAGTFAWVGAHNFTFGPAADWLETINVVFAIGAFVPVAAALANLLLSIDWTLARQSTPVRLALAGTAFYALLAVQILGLAFRSSSTVVQFTTWTEGTFVITVLGAGSLWLMALLSHLRGGGAVAMRLTVPGLGLLVATLWLGGLLAGFTWSAGPRSQDFVNYGEGFINTTGQLAGFDAVRWIAWVLIAVGFVWFAVRMLTPGPWQFSEVGVPSEGEEDPSELAPEKVAVAAVLIIGIAFLTTVLIPALDSSDQEPSLLAISTRDYDAFADGQATPQASDTLAQLGLDAARVAEGRDVYIAEGCVYCHTQQVRANVADVGLGAVTTSEDVVLTSPALLGRIRLGPDLAHAGSRPLTGDATWVIAHLRDPRAERGWSSMPSYDHLSEDDLQALAQYIVSLQ